MSQSRVCIQKSIDAAKKKCIKKTNLLAYEQNKCANRIPKVKRSYVPRISCAHAKQIRVCTAKELKKMCAPPKCKCPLGTAEAHQRARELAERRGFRAMMKKGFKGVLALAIVYATMKMGVWGDSCETHALYKSICEFFILDNPKMKEAQARAAAKWNPPPKSCEAESVLFSKTPLDSCGQPFLDTEKSSYWLQEKYNHVIYSLFSFMAGFPHNVFFFMRCCLMTPPVSEDDECSEVLVAGEPACELEDDDYGDFDDDGE